MPAEPAVIEQRLQPSQHRHRPVRAEVNALDEIGTGQVQRVFRDGLALVLQQSGGVGSEDLFNSRHNALLYHRVRQLLHDRAIHGRLGSSCPPAASFRPRRRRSGARGFRDAAA